MRTLLAPALLLACAACGSSPSGEPPDAGAVTPSDAAVSVGPDAAVSAGADAALPPPPGRKVLLYTGAGGGTPGSDLDVAAVASTLQAAGVTSSTGTGLPSDFDAAFGVLWLMNPMQAVPADVSRAAKALLARGGRVVLVFDHCKNGCWSNTGGDNDLLSSLGSEIRTSGTGGAPLSETSLQMTAVPKVTDGVASVVVYYSGSVTGGTTAGRVSGGDAVIAYQKVGLGDVVVVADTSAFGYVLAKGDNKRFVANLGVPLR